MAVKIEYRDGSSEIIKGAENVIHDKDHSLFLVPLEKNKIMIPDGVVCKIGIGRVETICTATGKQTTATQEVFVYE